MPGSKKSKTEAVFITEIKQSVEFLYPGAFWLKIPDIPIFKGSKTRFAPKKPFDFMFAFKGNLVCVEAKVHKKHTAWPLDRVKDHQLKGLQTIVKQGFRAYVFLNVRFGLGKNRFNKIFILKPDMIEYYKKEKKSLKIKELTEFANIIEYVKDKKVSIWGLENSLGF